ncbi:CaiB/BaiF CoA transferase family protein [Arabiibacter massiliensis]|uniref:CaiB/BaiF CoA transferase family protein n=1 Tax=Arabiibacter massiliensis TaxID=1870985 RepID=UPI0009BA2CF4|nr:CoA transferase [Arabiibacter massiliensis]
MKITEMPAFGNLQGLKVVACHTALAAPYCASVFAENGAEVISIENPGKMDVMKLYGRTFSMEHRNKRSLGLNLKAEGGKKVFSKLIGEADIFIENSKPGTWKKLGFSDEDLWAIKPDLVIVHISGFGQYGDPAFVPLPAYDMIGQAFSGIMSMNGVSNEAGPMYLKPYTCDYMSGLIGAWSALAAYINAKRTGTGESIDVAMYEAAARLQAGYLCDAVTDGKQPDRIGNGDSLTACDVVYRTSDDKWVILAIPIPSPAFIAEIGLGDDPELRDGGFVGRTDPRAPRYMQAIEDYVASHTRDEVLAMGAKFGMPSSPVLDYAECKQNPHWEARETLVQWYDPFTKTDTTGVGMVPKFKNNPGQIVRGSVGVGVDTDDILEEFGFQPDEIESLRAEGAVTGER